MQDRRFSDEELVAYLDGEEDFAPVSAIDAALPENPDLQERLEALSLDRAALAEAFDALVPDRVVVPMAPAPVSRARNRLWAGLSAAAVAGALALGFVLGSARSAPLNGWAEYVAAYQALYSSSTLAHLEPEPEAQQAELTRVAAAIGKSIDVEALGLFPEVAYRRAQILSYEGRPLIQLAFLTSTGEPMALCIIRSDKADAQAAPQLQTMEGLSTALWSLSGYDYILIGGQDDGLVDRMSATFRGMEI